MDKKDRIIDVIVNISSMIKKGEVVRFSEEGSFIGEEFHFFQCVELGEMTFLLQDENVYGLMEVAEMFMNRDIKEIHYHYYNNEEDKRIWGHRIFNAPKFN